MRELGPNQTTKGKVLAGRHQTKTRTTTNNTKCKTDDIIQTINMGWLKFKIFCLLRRRKTRRAKFKCMFVAAKIKTDAQKEEAKQSVGEA